MMGIIGGFLFLFSLEMLLINSNQLKYVFE
jgi:hypothetical protein